MKRIVVLSCFVLLIANVLLGLIISSYDTFNVVLSSCVLGVTAVFVLIADSISMKDAFKAVLTFLFAVGGLLCFFISVFAPRKFENNWNVIALILIVSFGTILLLIANTISKKIN